MRERLGWRRISWMAGSRPTRPAASSKYSSAASHGFNDSTDLRPFLDRLLPRLRSGPILRAALHLLAEDEQGEGPQLQQLVVPGGQREARRRRRLRSQALDLHLARLVGEGLAGPGDVPVDLDLGGRAGQPGADAQVDGALAVPAQRVQAGVDDQAHGPPGLAGQHAQALV